MPWLRFVSLLIFTASTGRVVAQSPSLPSGTPVDIAYQSAFATCDASNMFGGVPIPSHGCKSDPNKLTQLERIAATEGRPEAIVFTAKMAWDEDGSPKGCQQTGTNLCATSLMLHSTSTTPCNPRIAARPDCVTLDAATIPYVVKPGRSVWLIRNHKRVRLLIDGKAFSNRTGVDIGDYGVVIVNGRTVPVIVGDNGPAYKIGEGSTALLEAMSADGHPHTYSSGVTYVLFPGTREMPRPLPDGLRHHVACAGLSYYNVLIGKTTAARREAELSDCFAAS